MAKVLSPAKVNASILPAIKKFSEDSSWRIRYLVADRIIELANAMGKDSVKDHFLPFFCSFLEDKESEVRTAACGRIADFCSILDPTTIISKIVPTLKTLQTDTF